MAKYPELSLASVDAAIAYYFDDREQIERDIASENEAYEMLKAASPSKVKQKPEAADGNNDQIHLDQHAPKALAYGLRKTDCEWPSLPSLLVAVRRWLFR